MVAAGVSAIVICYIWNDCGDRPFFRSHLVLDVLGRQLCQLNDCSHGVAVSNDITRSGCTYNRTCYNCHWVVWPQAGMITPYIKHHVRILICPAGHFGFPAWKPEHPNFTPSTTAQPQGYMKLLNMCGSFIRPKKKNFLISKRRSPILPVSYPWLPKGPQTLKRGIMSHASLSLHALKTAKSTLKQGASM